MDNMKSTRIFLAEADPFRLAIYEQHFRNLGYTNIDFITSSINDNSNKSNNDIVFIEFRIAAKNNFALLQSIKQKNPDTYIVLITSKENLEKASNALHYGAFDLVMQGKYMVTTITEVLANILIAQKRVVQHPIPSNKTDDTLYVHADGTIDNKFW